MKTQLPESTIYNERWRYNAWGEISGPMPPQIGWKEEQVLAYGRACYNEALELAAEISERCDIEAHTEIRKLIK